MIPVLWIGNDLMSIRIRLLLWCRSASGSDFCFDADPDPDSDSDPDLDAYQVIRKSVFFFYFYSQQCHVYSQQCHVFLVNLLSVLVFWTKYWHFLEKSIAYHYIFTFDWNWNRCGSGSGGPGCRSGSGKMMLIRPIRMILSVLKCWNLNACSQKKRCRFWH